MSVAAGLLDRPVDADIELAGRPAPVLAEVEAHDVRHGGVAEEAPVVKKAKAG